MRRVLPATLPLHGPRALLAMLAVALLVNLLLFAVVYRLVMPRDVDALARQVTQFVEFVRLMPSTPEVDAARRDSLPPPPPPPQPAPPTPGVAAATAATGNAAPQAPESAPSLPALALPQAKDMDLLERALGAAPTTVMGGAGPGATAGAGRGGAGGVAGASLTLRADEVEVNLVPSYRLAPTYPLRALKEGIEGVVTVEFDIDVEGNVQAPRILHAEPPALFDEAVMRALPKWKFSPRLVDGRPVARHARQDVVFRLHRQ